jgi:hypothetical protein
MSFAEFFQSYLETALWSSTWQDDPDSEEPFPLDKEFSTDDFTEEALAEMRSDCVAFYAHYELWADGDDGRAGHDFWLTRNGHGAGFWDGDYENGDELTDLAHPYGSVDLYVTPDRKVGC